MPLILLDVLMGLWSYSCEERGGGKRGEGEEVARERGNYERKSETRRLVEERVGGERRGEEMEKEREKRGGRSRNREGNGVGGKKRVKE